MRYKKFENRNQIFTSEFLILYALLGIMEPVMKEKRAPWEKGAL
ncbi:Protein of unknown function [Bacillus cereus]|nr:Protein of unknown function [Bacillus cereus]